MTVDDFAGEEFEFDTPHTEHTDENIAFYEKSVREIARGDSYVCMICTVEMDYTCTMHACSQCYRVFDYDCIREWAVKSTKRTVDASWKCPNCLHVSHKVPAKDKPRCWCGKVVRPDPNPMDPNSCGQTCNARTCRHGCSKICHLGPHEECMRTMSIKCRCGKHKKSIFCYQAQTANSKKRFRCDDECGKTLPCGIHRCKKTCHSGNCGSCPEILKAKEEDTLLICYCGHNKRDHMKCKDVKPAKKVSRNEDGDAWKGLFSCNKKRSVKYSCLKHSFIEKCKPKPTLDGKTPCPYSPKLLKACPCGKSALKTLASPRKLCTDPIPTCESKCDKLLSCGKHMCPFKCHDGPCMDPCIQSDVVTCSCHQKMFTVPCSFEHQPSCNMKCESLMSCRRHRCPERCCSGKPLAEVRRKTPYTSSELQDESLVEAQHICLKDCNLTLSCGRHKCQQKCHPGKCPPCLESDSNDLVCPCGKTIVAAPVRCGTKLPTCEYPCIKVVQGLYECGHKPMPHTCHPVDQLCPPCTAPVMKPCICGKKDKVRTICFQNNVSCGQKCDQQLFDCPHKCQKSCHIPGDCQTKCKQICRVKKMYCDHSCPRPCHGKTNCPDTPCTALVKIKCKCGIKEVEMVCGAYSMSESSLIKEIVLCDDNCEIQRRQSELKEAFGICEQTKSFSLSEVSSFEKLIASAASVEELELPFTEPALVIYSKHVSWCSSIENILNTLMDDPNKNSLHFKPMKQPQRNFIHELAKSYKLYSESQDRDPQRSVFIKKIEASICGKPILSLKEALSLYQSFKQLEKDRLNEKLDSQYTTRMINVTSKETPRFESAENNGFSIVNIASGTTEQDLERIYSAYLKPTLIKNPQYMIVEGEDKGLIFPEDYADITVNVERDLEELVGHFDYICKESFIGDGVRLCKVDVELLSDNRAVDSS